MTVDVDDLHTFYQSRLGQMVCRHISQKITQFWPDAVGDRMVGYGYALPYLERYRLRSERVLAFMPCSQGAISWPEHKANLVALTPANCLPLPDQSIDRFLMIHALEHTQDPAHLLREVWRVLGEGGRLLIVVPNRRGFWARHPSTPFGCGKPYSGRQLFAFIEESLFTPCKPKYALFSPPYSSRFVLSLSDSLEHIGTMWVKKWGGVTLIEAYKQIASVSLEMSRGWPASLAMPITNVSSSNHL